MILKDEVDLALALSDANLRGNAGKDAEKACYWAGLVAVGDWR